MTEEINAIDLRVAELQALLREQTEKHAFQTKRADDLERKLRTTVAAVKGEIAAHEKTKRECDARTASMELAVNSNFVALDGQSYKIVGTFRADSTFVEVKKGHCDEGITLVAIDKVH